MIYSADWTPYDDAPPIDEDWATEIEDAIQDAQSLVSELESLCDEDLAIGAHLPIARRLEAAWQALEAHVKEIRSRVDVSEFNSWPLHSEAVSTCVEACGALAGIAGELRVAAPACASA